MEVKIFTLIARVIPYFISCFLNIRCFLNIVPYPSLYLLFFHPESDTCEIAEVNGFLKRRCYDAFNDHAPEFQCAFTEEKYRVFQPLIEESSDTVVTDFCSNDTFGYQVSSMMLWLPIFALTTDLNYVKFYFPAPAFNFQLVS